MNAMCPVSFQKINENLVRLNAGQAVLFLCVFCFTPWKWVILLVAADFGVRGFGNPKYSLFANISKRLLALLRLNPVLTDAAPKIFAARVGFLFSCMLVACWLLQLNAAALIIGLMFGVCAFLEAAFRFCIACKLYPLVCRARSTR